MLPFELTKDTPYLALSGELWSVFYEYFNRNWSCYKGFLLYVSYWYFDLHQVFADDASILPIVTKFNEILHQYSLSDIHF